MSLHEAFLRSIIESPDDDAPRLAYSDWLEEHGDADRAEFIRVQCRLASIDADDPERRELQEREYELLAEHWGEWAGPLVGRVHRWQFRRGFVEQVSVKAGRFLKEAKWLLDFAPIRELRVDFPELEDMRAVLASKHIRRITRLDLDGARLGNAGAALLADSPNLAGLTDLSLRFNEIGSAGLLALARSTHLRSLRSLNLSDFNSLRRPAFRPFVSECRLPSLERLHWDGGIGPTEVRALLSAPLAGQLTYLFLSAKKLGPKGLRLLAESAAFPRLTELGLLGGSSSAADSQLGHSPLLSGLTSLALRNIGLTDEGVAELARDGQAPSLRRLDLSFNEIGPDAARALARSALCDGLTRLDLSGTSLGDRGVKAVVTSPRLGNLHRLDLSDCGVTWRGVKALLSSPHLDRLACLSLEGTRIGRKAFDALHARLGERLYHEHFDDGLDGPEVIRRVQAAPPRCLRGLGARPDTELLRRFPRQRLPLNEFPCVSFELTHPDPRQKAVLLGYEDTRGLDLFFSPFAIRWEPSGEEREFFDAEQHGRSGETDGNCTIVGSGKRTPWQCGRRGCRDHTFLVTFIYRLEYPPTRYADRYLPFADQFYHFDLDAYCATQDHIMKIASFECQ
jgi:uncharacterized protein (TIGR02996 family)